MPRDEPGNELEDRRNWTSCLGESAMTMAAVASRSIYAYKKGCWSLLQTAQLCQSASVCLFLSLCLSLSLSVCLSVSLAGIQIEILCSAGPLIM